MSSESHHHDNDHEALSVPPGSNSNPALQKVQGLALVIGVLSLVLGIASAYYLASSERILVSYLIGFMLVLGLPLGCLSLLMIQHLTGGEWGFAIRRPAEAGTRLIPLLAVLFLPVAYGMISGHLYTWNSPEQAEQHAQVTPIRQQFAAAVAGRVSPENALAEAQAATRRQMTAAGYYE